MKSKLRIIALLIVLSFVFISSLYAFFWRTPKDFPINTLKTVEKGTGLNLLATNLEQEKIIRSPFWFKVVSVLVGGPKGIVAGDYVIFEKENVFTLAYRFSTGDFGLTPTKITIPEGLNVFEIGDLLEKKFSKVSKDDFVKTAGPDEGYLFPDTYFFLPNTSTKEIVSELKDNFNKKIVDLNELILAFGRPLTDIIKMASIIEEEARIFETKRIIAGILWKRLELGMPLQVDASFKYVNGKTTADLTLLDLKIDSPYNTYVYKGLPPTPISNPGLDSIKATITPIKTDYLYFLTDKEGNMHYAKTHDGHLQNKQLYLK